MMKRKIMLLTLFISFISLLSGCSSVGIKIDYELNLPSDYFVEIKVVQSSKHGETTTYYSLSESSDGWVYIKLGYDREQYVYKPLSEGKYIEYKYDEIEKKYKATNISDALQEQIDKGNVTYDSVATSVESVNSRKFVLNNYLIPYLSMGSIFTKGENTKVLDIDCETYDGYVNTLFTKSNLHYEVDPVTGLVLYMKNDTKTFMISTSQINECTTYSTEANIPEI
ncbi:MAG: hypothetical protein K6G38_06060 [Gammaproteobacteria bacterium]|nr:hypothetical protein [Gammaproteobacteria bacterium]